MKKTIQISILLIFLYSTLSCKQVESEIISYNEVAAEFSTQIFSEEYYDCGYIIKPNAQNSILEDIASETQALEYRNTLMKILKLSNLKTLDSMLNLSKDFDFKDSMFKKGIELIDSHQYIEIRTEIDSIVKYGTKKEKEKLFQECPSSFYFISKPIFDEKYETALIFIKNGFSCFPSQPWIFELNNGIWEPPK